MHRLNLFSLALLLLSPLTLLASYFWNRPFQKAPTSHPPSEQQSAVPSPDSLSAPSLLLPYPSKSNQAIAPLNRAYSLPRADYLPPLPAPAHSHRAPKARPIPGSESAHQSSAPLTKTPISTKPSAPTQNNLLLGANPVMGATTGSSGAMPFLSGPTPNSSAVLLPAWISTTLDPERTSSRATAPTVTILPPSSTVMTMTSPLDASPTGPSASTSTALNNPTSAVFAQADPDPIRQELLIQPLAPSQLPYRQQRVVGAPAATLSTPTGYGASLGQVFMGLSLINRGRGNNQADGSATIGFGLGDPRRAVGFDVAVNVISLSDSNGQDSFAGSGNVGFKLHRMLPGEIGVAVGWENALAWGDARTVDSSVYGAVSRAFFLQPDNLRNPMPLILSMGVGGGRFRSEEAIRRGDNTLGFFASAGLQLSPQFSLLANWTGQDLNVGASFIPFPEIPFSLTLSAADLTGSAGDGARFALGLGYGTRFSF